MRERCESSRKVIDCLNEASEASIYLATKCIGSICGVSGGGDMIGNGLILRFNCL